MGHIGAFPSARESYNILFPMYPGLLIPLKTSTHVVNHGTWSARWWISSYQTVNGVRWGANRFGVRLSGYETLEGLLAQLKSRAL